MTVKYVSGRVKELKIGITSYSESKESLSVIGNVAVGGTTTSDILVPDNRYFKLGAGVTAVSIP